MIYYCCFGLVGLFLIYDKYLKCAATNREKGQGVTRTRAGAAPCKNGLARTLGLKLSLFLVFAGFV
jgi:hypothetical protein